MLVQEIMSTELVCVEPDQRLGEVRALFERHRFHHLLVVERGRLLGVISDRDLLKNISIFAGHALNERARDAATLERRVHQIMSRQAVTIHPLATVMEAAQVMLEARVSCLPVVEARQRPVGVLTTRDLLRALAEPPQTMAA